ncbi:MAG TPA: DUF2723 domain-containing protein [Kofleriaceae bacterium]|nr:DUF2723 domain-containing protein [Kofleriaceae bacterium]
MKSVVQRALDRGYLLGLVAFVVYAWLASPSIVGNDNAEFSTLGAVGGMAHPSGYPIYVLWLRAMSWIPGTPAHAAAIATAMLGAAAVVVLHAACRAWGARSTAASVAVAVFASAPVVLRLHTEAEAFALNALVVATVLWLAAAAGPLRGARRALALGLVAGLGLSGHLTCSLVAPVGLLGVLRGSRESRPTIAIVAAIGGVVVGLTPYVYLFIAPESMASWHGPQGIGDLVMIVTRQQYGGTLGFMGGTAPVPTERQLAELAFVLARAWRWVLLPVGVGVLGYRIVRPRGETRAAWFTLAVSFIVAGPLLVMRFDVEPEGLGLNIIHRFHELPVLLLAIPIASGLEQLGQLLASRLGSQIPGPRIGAGLAIVGFVALVATSLPEHARMHSPAMENGVRGMLEAFPDHAIVLTTTDEYDVGIHYLQLARGERDDVLAFRPIAASASWYRARLAAFGVGLDPGMSQTEIAARALATGRPLFVHRGAHEIIAAYPGYAFGTFVRVLPRGASVPSLAEIVAMNRALFEHLDLDYPPPGRDDEFATLMHLRYANVWRRLGDAQTAAGDRDGAATSYALSAQLAPR